MPNNGRLFTILAIALIVFSGVTLVDNPSNWWMSALAVLSIGLIAFLFMNARVFVKVVFVSVMNLLFATTAFQVGSGLDPLGGGLVWMGATLFTFFALLSLSYLLVSGRSRWGAIGTATLLGFITAMVVSVSGVVSVSIAAAIGTVVALVAFVLVFKFTNRTRYNQKNMPLNVLNDDLLGTLVDGFHEAGYTVRPLTREPKSRKVKSATGRTTETVRANEGDVLVFKDHAFLLHPVEMDQQFTEVGTRRTARLGYHKKAINPWLLSVAFRRIPHWRSRNAPIMLVLLDVKNANGKTPRVVGVSLPDTKRKLAVGVVPGRGALNNKDDAVDDLIEALEGEMSVFTSPLKEKHIKAMTRFAIPIRPQKSDSDQVDENSADSGDSEPSAADEEDRGNTAAAE